MGEHIGQTLEELKADRDAYRDAIARHAPSESLAAIDEAFGAAGLSRDRAASNGWSKETPERVLAERDFFRRELRRLMPGKTEVELRAVLNDRINGDQLLAAVEAMIRDGDGDEHRPG
jgi:hypothetical protein